MRISGRHAQVYLASPHVGTSDTDGTPVLLQTENGTIVKYGRDGGADLGNENAAHKSPWVSVSDWIRSIDINTSGATEQVTGLNKLAHERLKLLSDLTGTFNGTVGIGSTVSRLAPSGAPMPVRM